MIPGLTYLRMFLSFVCGWRSVMQCSEDMHGLCNSACLVKTRSSLAPLAK